MSKKAYEANWDTLDPTKQKKLLIQWAKQSAPLPNDQLLFALENVVKSKDEDLDQNYFDYLNKFVFKNKDQSLHFISSLPYNDAVVAFVLRALSADMLRNFIFIIALKEKFSSILLESGHYLNNTKKLFAEIDQSVLSHIVAFSFSEKTPIADFFLYLYLVFSEQIFDPNKRYLDKLYQDKSHHQHLLDFFQYFNRPGIQKKFKYHDFTYNDIKELYARYVESVNYSRENVQNASVENQLFIEMANFFYGNQNLSFNFFQNIQVVLKNIINFPNPSKQDELQKHFEHICALEDHIISAFVSYLYNSDPKLASKLFKKMSQDSKLYAEFSNKIDTKRPDQNEVSKQSEQEERANGDEPEADSVQEESHHSDETPEEIKLGYFDAEGWEVKRSILTLNMIYMTSDEAPSELLNAIDKLAEHARKHLGNKKTSDRAKEGQQKYQELENLFSELSQIKAKSSDEALTQARDILNQQLDKDPKDSDLLKNRGGFFGAYKTFSKIYSKFGLLHYDYTTSEGEKRTAESTTDHLLIALIDSIDEQLASVSHSVEN